jgi:hypothetical protein
MAQADAFTEILADVQGDFAAGQAEFSAALTDFSHGLSGVPDGLTAYFTGLNDYEVLPSDQLLLGEVEALAGQPIDDLSIPALGPPPLDLATGIADAQAYSQFAEGFLANAAVLFETGDLVDAVGNYITGTFFSLNAPVDEVLIGGLDQVLLGL